MGRMDDLDSIAKTVQGVRVSKEASDLPQSAAGDLFVVSGGRVKIIQIMGKVDTIIENQACNAKISHDPDVGAAADLCADALITADAVGTNYGITGTVANALVVASHAYLVAQAAPLILPAGVITLTTDASNTGQVSWDILYVPIDRGARVEVA